MDYLALSFELRQLDPPVVEAYCLTLGALAITLSDARDDAVLEPAPGEVRLWPGTRLQALFAGDVDRAAMVAHLAQQFGLAAGHIRTETLADRAWEREWLRDFHALRFGRRLWVCPHHENVLDPSARVVKLDPGLAFGTGTHPSTALCLEWLDAHLNAGMTVIDYGSGSGILGVAAAVLGAAHVAAYDIDPQALLATTENALANQVAPQVSVHADPATLPPRVDVLLANILAGTLCELGSDFAQRLVAGGQIVLAGILAEQAESVADVYAPWFEVSHRANRDGWVLLAGTRRTLFAHY